MDFYEIVDRFEAALTLPRDWSFGVGDESVEVSLQEISVTGASTGAAKVAIDFRYSGSYEYLLSVMQEAIKGLSVTGVTLGAYTVQELDTIPKTLRVVYDCTMAVNV